jgi:hypothetical protein
VTATTEAGTEPVVIETERDRLSQETSKLRSRRSLPLDRMFQRIGGALLGIGLLAIVGGWYGVSHTARAWRQTPYVVSGGLLGLALVFIGCFAYFAYWLTRLVDQSNRQIAVLERIEEALTGGVADEGGLVLADGVLHRAACPLVAARTDAVAYDGKKKVTQTCSVCDPVV